MAQRRHWLYYLQSPYRPIMLRHISLLTVGLQLAPSSLYRSYEKGQCGSQRSPYNVMFQPPGYSPQSPLVLPEEVFTYPTGVGEAVVFLYLVWKLSLRLA